MENLLRAPIQAGKSWPDRDPILAAYLEGKSIPEEDNAQESRKRKHSESQEGPEPKQMRTDSNITFQAAKEDEEVSSSAVSSAPASGSAESALQEPGVHDLYYGLPSMSEVTGIKAPKGPPLGKEQRDKASKQAEEPVPVREDPASEVPPLVATPGEEDSDDNLDTYEKLTAKMMEYTEKAEGSLEETIEESAPPVEPEVEQPPSPTQPEELEFAMPGKIDAPPAEVVEALPSPPNQPEQVEPTIRLVIHGKPSDPPGSAELVALTKLAENDGNITKKVEKEPPVPPKKKKTKKRKSKGQPGQRQPPSVPPLPKLVSIVKPLGDLHSRAEEPDELSQLVAKIVDQRVDSGETEFQGGTDKGVTIKQEPQNDPLRRAGVSETRDNRSSGSSGAITESMSPELAAADDGQSARIKAELHAEPAVHGSDWATSELSKRRGWTTAGGPRLAGPINQSTEDYEETLTRIKPIAGPSTRGRKSGATLSQTKKVIQESVAAVHATLGKTAGDSGARVRKSTVTKARENPVKITQVSQSTQFITSQPTQIISSFSFKSTGTKTTSFNLSGSQVVEVKKYSAGASKRLPQVDGPASSDEDSCRIVQLDGAVDEESAQETPKVEKRKPML